MPIIIPLNNYGNREITVDTLGGGYYRFRAYFSDGFYGGWFFDITEVTGGEENPLRGVRIVPGCPNLLKGFGDRFKNIQLACAIVSGNENTPEALGNGTYVVWFNAGEENPFKVGDPLIDIPYDEWAFDDPSINSKYFSHDGNNVRVRRYVRNNSKDNLFTLDLYGVMRLKPELEVLAEDDYMILKDDGGDVVLKGSSTPPSPVMYFVSVGEHLRVSDLLPTAASDNIFAIQSPESIVFKDSILKDSTNNAMKADESGSVNLL